MAWIGRERQVEQLTALLASGLPGPPVLVVHGAEATGKSVVLQDVLRGSAHAIVKCENTITTRHLLESTIVACSKSQSGQAKCENISAFVNNLDSQLQSTEKFVLVFDAIDGQQEALPTLLPALARAGKAIPGLTIVFVVTHPTPRFLHTTGVPHVYFPPYQREQAVAILASTPLPIHEDHESEDDLWLWTRFCQAVWDSLSKGAASDLLSFRELAERLWRPFVKPVVGGTYGTRDFSRLVIAQKKLLQDETGLSDNILTGQEIDTSTLDLPYYSKWILCGAYLASHNPARLDPVYFMKAAERKRKKKGGGTAAGRQSKQRKIARHLLSPANFSIDRLFAILHAILPHDLYPTIDVYTQVATLASLRLLLRSGMVGADLLEPGARWKVGFGLDFAKNLARNIGFDLVDYLVD